MSAPSSSSPTFVTCVERLLADLEYRYQPLALLPRNADYWDMFHQWMVCTLGPTTSWSEKRLAELEHASGGIIERGYPYADLEVQLLYAKITALAILVDDIMDDEATCAELAQFSHNVFLGKPQTNAMLALYHDTLKEASHLFEGSEVLRDMAVIPWIVFIDGCLVEKQMFNSQLGNSSAPEATYLEGFAPNFPRFLRGRSGASESYVAGIFKATKAQHLPLDRFIKAVPDAVFFCDVTNDILSFYKEELAGETHNFIHIRTRALAAAGKRGGSGPAGEWTAHDTLRLLCQELLDAARRVDGVLRLEECERKMRGEVVDGVDDLDVEIAKQWRGWRDGYISWHFECRRYKLNTSGVAWGGSAL